MARVEAGRKSRKRPAASAVPDAPIIPDKLYFRIGEVSRLLEIAPYVLRFWESEFPQLKPNKGGTGQRLYRRRDVEMVLRIKHLLYRDGYTIPGARQLLRSELRPSAAVGASAPVAVREAPHSRRSASAGESLQLRQVHSELTEIAKILSRPIAGGRRPGPPARGLPVPSRRLAGATSPLFPEAVTPPDRGQ